MDEYHPQPPCPEHDDRLGGQEGDTNGAPIVYLNVAQDAGELVVPFDQETMINVVWTSIKGM